MNLIYIMLMANIVERFSSDYYFVIWLSKILPLLKIHIIINTI